MKKSKHKSVERSVRKVKEETASFDRSRLSEWYEVLGKCRISLTSVVLVLLVFTLSDQAQDVLRALGQPGAAGQILSFEFLLSIWTLMNWSGARFLLDQDFLAMRMKRQSLKKPRTLYGEKAMPRILGAAGMVGMGVALLMAVRGVEGTEGMHYGRVRTLGMLNILGGAIFYLLVKYRTNAMRWLSALSTQKIQRPALRDAFTYRERERRVSFFGEFPSWVRWTIWSSLVIAVIIWAVVFLRLQQVAPRLGSASILLLGFFFLTLFGTGLVWVGERFHLPMIIIAFMVAGVFGLWNDNHAVRQIDGSSNNHGNYFTARELYQSWLAKMDRDYPEERPHPMFIVAASGGGIRAAYWTASVLGVLQDQNESFASHTIVVSSVSGGALGSLVFAGLVAGGSVGNTPQEGVSERGQTILSRDFLSPALGALLFYDLPARFWPFPNQIPDRAKALEVAWENGWKPGGNGQSPFARGFSSLLKGERNHAIPTLLINGTSVETGERILTAHLDLAGDFPDCGNALLDLPHDIRMSTAGTMSARFTYVSPAGTLASGVHVVDGGYYENSGAATALEFFDAVKSEINEDRVAPIFIQIDNDYVATHDVKRYSAMAKDKKESTRSWRLFPEIQSPIIALLNTRNAHAASLAEQAKKEFGSRYFFYTFSIPGDVKAPLGWFLSYSAQEGIRKQLQGGSAKVNTMLIGGRLSAARSTDKDGKHGPTSS